MQSKFGVVLGVIAVVLAIAAIVGPWWVVDSTASFGPLSETGHADYGLFGGTSTTKGNLSSSTNTTNYADTPAIGSVFSVATILSILGLVLGIGMLVIAALPGANPSFRRFALITGGLAFIVLLVASLYVMSALPGAVNQDSGGGPTSTTFSGFWGTKSVSFFGAQATVTWAAGWGWYLALVAGIVFLVAGVVMLASRKPAMPVPQMVPPS